MSNFFYGVGTNSRGKYKTAGLDGKRARAYGTWKNMLRRAYCPKAHAKWPAYVGCSVTDEWLEYQNFAKWFENHEYSNRGYHLDKDLLTPGNKIYAPDRCAFVPQQLNNLLLDSGAIRGQYRQGVSFHKGKSKFRADIRIGGKPKGLGDYDNELEAYRAYKKAKEEHVKSMANHWRDDIATNVYEALMQWKLEEAK